MRDHYQPADEAQLAELLAWACQRQMPLDLLGSGSKRRLGRPVQAAATLSLAELRGITLYEPNELVMRARAGTPLAEITAALSEHRQHLAFEPADYGPLLGEPAGQGTIGGVFAANLAGPRRFFGGGARDHILGVASVSGRGEVFKAGGRVVKNVTGFDLPKLLAGSYGTLAAITELTFKVLPQPEEVRSVLLPGLDDATANRAMTRALQSPHEVSAAAHLPAALTQAGRAVTALRVEGPGPSVSHRCAALRRELCDVAPADELDTSESLAFWRDVRDVRPLWEARAVWRLQLPPADAAATVAAIARVLAVRALYDRGGGLVWLGTDEVDAGADAVRSHAACATLVRASAEIRAHIPVFPPLPEPLRLLSQRVKDAFDPHRILNPGRMYAGM